MNRIGPRASKSRGSDSEYVHAYHDYNVIDRHPGMFQIHLLTMRMFTNEFVKFLPSSLRDNGYPDALYTMEYKKEPK